MQIRELKLNVQFEYIREIRKYIYDIETMLRENGFCDSLNPVPPLPDDVEPQVERLSTIKNEENKDIHIFVSQASLAILLVYKTPIDFKDIFNEDVKYISTISKKLKSFIKTKISKFKINFEGLVVATSKTILKNDESLIKKLDIALDIEEDRRRVTKKIDDKHFSIVEKSILRIYNSEPNINPMAVKYDFNSFIAWDYIVVIEVHNKQEYNISNDNKRDLELDLNFAKDSINKYLYKEAI
ncbi:MAG: hypothetical protein RBQ81_01380 [Arcobacteraceae bacterium]|jgi:hypothetical protein|nr:hypothetical protein [Arcobacteraceae bacterium]MDY0364493.1 hypothetical protein [Arcobacteraceae bacterium]